MRLLNMFTSSMLISCVMTVAQAGQTLSCPSVEQVRQVGSLLNVVNRINSHLYIVSTDKPVIQKDSKDWTIGVHFDAKNDDGALTLGQQYVAKTVSLLTQDAIEDHGDSICGYYIQPNVIAFATTGKLVPMLSLL